MEIIFNKLCYVNGKNTSASKKYLEDVSLKIKQGTIVGFVGDDLTILGHLLMGIKKPTKGELIIGGISIKRNSRISNANAFKKQVGFVYNDIMQYTCSTIKEEIKEHMKNYGYKTKNVTKHISDSLKLVGFDDSYLDRDPSTLSFTEQKKLQLASVISYNPEVIILDNFEKGLINRDREYFRKMFLKLKNKFDKTIIIISDDLTFMFDIVNDVYVINNGKLKLSGNKKIFYKDELYKYIEMPAIVSFTKYAKEQGHNILEYTDLKELIKELYRNAK